MPGGSEHLPPCDLFVTGFGVLPDLDLPREANGEGRTIADACVLSYVNQCTLLAAADTLVHGCVRRSCIVIDRGDLLDICDMAHTPAARYQRGGTMRVYDTACGKLGILLDADLFYPAAARLHAVNGADVLVCVCDTLQPIKPLLFSTVHCAANGLPGVFVAPGSTRLLSARGAISPLEGVTPLPLLRDQTLSKARRDDLYRNKFSDIT
jgi:predicted amidohydrolase